MKKKFTRFFVILAAVICLTGISPLFVHSQSYHKLIRTNTYWDVYMQAVICDSYADRIYFTGIDTIIAGNHYNLSRQYPYRQVNSGPFCPPFVISDTSYGTSQFMREDTIARKVFIYCPDCNPHDQLFYDFSLSVGDTLKSQVTGAGLTLILASIDTVVLQDSELRKRFNFPCFDHSCNYIESIGGSQGLFNSIVPGEFDGGYFCISENDTSLWGTSCNYYFVGMREQQESRLSIYPNPATEKITVEISGTEKESTLTIVNIEGQELITRQITKPKTQIDISNLPSGIYFLRLTNDKTVEVVKFVKLL